MVQDIKEFIATCTVCSRGQSSHCPSSGLLHPLPVPSRPWSEISIDFVTSLPPSDSHTVILTVVDRFSKMVHFGTLPKLPSAAETADLLVAHVFRLYGIRVDIVSDRGPLFTSQV